MQTLIRYRNTSWLHLIILAISLSWITTPVYAESADSNPLYHLVPRWLTLLILAVALVWMIQPAHGESPAPDGHEQEEVHSEEGHIPLTPEQIKHAGFAIDRVGPASIRETLPLYGQIVPNAEREHTVSARFPGVIRKVTKQVGDSVKQGETLATVESNESLKSYAVVASLTGIVAERNANVGEQTGDREMFVIGDYSTVWVDVAVFPGDLSKVRVGKGVLIANNDASVRGEGRIIAISPTGSRANQTTTARVLLDNPARQWVPGHFVSAEVVLSETAVPIAIREEAVQIMGDETVVFVASDEGFEARPVTLGRSDGQLREVLTGLEAGEEYVTANSFILKSELGKEDAEHGH
ncbi:HlyD family efflux transporter periplasmic adaptor subunit [Halieaceae bacterium IMCC14734]|uniref:HlyD family efflux transporter periplasmic adaptor subunit n=1 Tax=Candidatus Litorirhabdus singularis TaxID=2518993 RepID=A0ABT3TK56_9GAMM|nr:efflux RND transporter periplasmic adaptor subunit [Candidatus Litorirhabdus singularis]MCX2982690.1 HlyD family efflux transporter periplasmic adaptor subunit [Candidatus Litorirhabdus singularis]